MSNKIIQFIKTAKLLIRELPGTSCVPIHPPTDPPELKSYSIIINLWLALGLHN